LIHKDFGNPSALKALQDLIDIRCLLTFRDIRRVPASLGQPERLTYGPGGPHDVADGGPLPWRHWPIHPRQHVVAGVLIAMDGYDVEIAGLLGEDLVEPHPPIVPHPELRAKHEAALGIPHSPRADLQDHLQVLG